MRDQTEPRNRRHEDKKTPGKPAGEQNSGRQDQVAQDGHLGATEDQVSDTTPPAGSAFEDEPKQG